MKNTIHIINHVQIIVYSIDKIMIVIIRIAITHMKDNDLMIIILQEREELELVIMKMKENVSILHQRLKVELLLIIIKKLIDEVILPIKHNVHLKLIILFIK